MGKANKVHGKEKHRVEISNRVADLAIESEVDINSASETI
jgi:hypothetical protein